MRKSIALKVAVSPLILGIATVGCASADRNGMFRPVAASAAEQRADTQSAQSFQQAHKLMQTGDFAAALGHAENAVEQSPQDAGYRMLLGELYMKNGRFRSAASAFKDALTLNPENNRGRFNLALAQIASGDRYAALGQLEQLSSTASAADIGLAYALAGQPDRAVAMLEPAARDAAADGRVRQNLALSYALLGDWQRARITAAQDLSPADLLSRMEQWAAFAQPQAAHDQVASLLGVTAVEDAGQPTRLALAIEAQQPVQSAEAAAQEAPVYAAAAETPPAPAPAEYSKPQPAYAEAAAPAPIGVQVVTPEAKVIRTRIAPPTPRMASKGRFVVQIGAYDSAKSASTAWSSLQRRYKLSGHAPVTARVSLPKGVFHRLSVAGFGTQNEAARACQSIKAKGGSCFVRSLSGDAPIRLASR